MSKKLTLANMKAILNEQIEPVAFQTATTDGGLLNIAVDVNVDLDGIYTIVNFVADHLFTPAGVYAPEYRDVMTFVALMQEVTNIPVPVDKDGSIDILTCYKWMKNTRFLEWMEGSFHGYCHASDALIDWFDNIHSLISEKINFKKQEILASHQSEYSNLIAKMEQLLDTFSKIVPQFENFDPAELMDLTRDIAGKDQKELVSAVIDIHEAQESKRKSKAGKKPTNKKEKE